MKYREDVDGLRGLAVVAVVLFHADLGFSGGFVGVDVFFVISGFLITSIIRDRQEVGGFSLFEFWSRRIRRLVPAATAMSLLALGFGALLFLPADAAELGKSVIAQQAMLSNIFFYRKSGYFDASNEFKPLLHTWSLAVEEHFYILYPLLLMMMARCSRRFVGSVVLSLAVGSLVLNETLMSIDPKLCFYMMPSRAWEMLIGGLLAFVPKLGRSRVGLGEWCGLVGVSLVIVSMVVFDKTTRFPGVHAAIPCVGTALVIFSSGSATTFVGRVFCFRPLVKVGRISYSLYLWHWPVIVMAKYRLGQELSLTTRLVAIVVSCVLAIVSYRMVEVRWRSPLGGVGEKRKLTSVVMAIPVVIAIGAVLAVSGGVPSLTAEIAMDYYDYRGSKAFIHEVSLADIASDRVPEFGAKDGRYRCILWGDSHAMALMPGVNEACVEAGVRGWQCTHSSTPPLLSFRADEVQPRRGATVADFSEAVFDFAVRKRADCVFLAGYWSSYVKNESFQAALESTVSEFAAAQIKLVIVQDVAYQKEHIPLAFARRSKGGGVPVFRGIENIEHRERNDDFDSMLSAIGNDRVIVVDPADYLVDVDGRWRVAEGRKLLYRDSHHLSVEGGLALTPMFAKSLELLARGEWSVQR